MTANEFRETLERLGVTHAEIARLFEAGQRTTERWWSEGVPNGPANVLLRLLRAGKIKPRNLFEIL